MRGVERFASNLPFACPAIIFSRSSAPACRVQQGRTGDRWSCQDPTEMALCGIHLGPETAFAAVALFSGVVSIEFAVGDARPC